MSLLDKVREKLEEKGNEEQTYVHTVHIGVGGYNNFVVAESVYALSYTTFWVRP